MLKEKTLSLKEIVQQCISCGYCGICPTYMELGSEQYHPRGRLKQVGMYLDNPDNNEISRSLFDAVFACTMCSACQNICMVDLPLIRVWEDIRQQAFQRGRWDKKLISLYNLIKKSKNIFGKKPSARLDWSKSLDIDISQYQQKKSDILFFVGCQSSYSKEMQNIARSMVKILHRANIDFTIMSTDEWCCGAPLILGGAYDLVIPFAEHNYERIKEMQVKTIITTCASCYRVLKKDYSNILDEWDIEVIHSTEFVKKLLDEEKLSFSKPINEKVTYKDPCELARYCGTINEPREILKHITGLRYEELPSNKNEAKCCGGGGLLQIVNRDLVSKVNERLFDDITYTECDIVTSCCPLCISTINKGAQTHDISVESIDLIELVVRCMEEK